MRSGAFAAPLAILLLAAGGCKNVPPPEAAYCIGVPQLALQGRVTDFAAILSEEEESRLSERLARYEHRTKHQMVIASVPDLHGATVEDFATCLGNRWEVGREEQDDGILILVAPNERRLRIATGYGMEKSLPDEKAKAVIETMTPFFRQGDYDAGLSKGIDAIAAQTGDLP